MSLTILNTLYAYRYAYCSFDTDALDGRVTIDERAIVFSMSVRSQCYSHYFLIIAQICLCYTRRYLIKHEHEVTEKAFVLRS